MERYEESNLRWWCWLLWDVFIGRILSSWVIIIGAIVVVVYLHTETGIGEPWRGILTVCLALVMAYWHLKLKLSGVDMLVKSLRRKEVDPYA